MPNLERTCQACGGPLPPRLGPRPGPLRKYCLPCSKPASARLWREKNADRIEAYNLARRLAPHELGCWHCDRAFQAKRRDTTYCTGRCKSLAKWQRARAAREAVGIVVARRTREPAPTTSTE